MKKELNIVVKVRQDAWSHEDDLLLAETVLRHIREGSTQLNAFEEVGDVLNRTSAACGFRWNAEVRMKYDNAIDLAKRQRKEKKRAAAGRLPSTLNKEKKASTSGTVVENMQNTQHTLPYQENNQQQSTDKTYSIGNQPNSLSLDMVISYLEQFKKDYNTSKYSKNALEEMQNENNLLKDQNSKLENALKKKDEQINSIQEEYQVFLQIMDRARQMTVLEDQGTLKSPSFRMDKNGNLQQLAEGSN